jgi:hypothetical protein
MSVTSLQQQWQSEVDTFLADKGEATKQSLAYANDEKALKDKMQQNTGIKRLKNIFIRATKLAPLHHRQKKLAKHVAAEKKHIEGDAASTYYTLGETAVQGSKRENFYNELGGIYNQIDRTRDIVLSAANQCSSASSDESFAAMDDKNIGMDWMASSAASSAESEIRDAQRAVKNLLKTVKNLPEVDASFADEIGSLNNNAFFMDLTGSFFGTFANWDVSNKLDDAENHLRSVASELATEMNNVSADMRSVRQAALADARKSDSNVEKLAASIEDYLPGANRSRTAKLKP